MATNDFNSAKCTFPTTSTVLGTGLRDANDGQSGADVDLSVTTSSFGTGRQGIVKKEINITVLGTSTSVHGDTGAIKLIFGTTGDNDAIWTIASAYVSSKTVGGGMDGEVTTQFTFRPRKSS